MRYFAAFCVPADFTDLRLISQKHGKSGQIADVCSSQIVVKICGFTTKDFAQGGTSLTSITIPDEVTDIENYVFRGCDNITSITIPDSVFGIGDGVFASCSSLTSITIPDNVTLNPIIQKQCLVHSFPAAVSFKFSCRIASRTLSKTGSRSFSR